MEIHSDQGANFERYSKKLAKSLTVIRTTLSVVRYNSRNRTNNRHLVKVISDQSQDLDQRLYVCLIAYRFSIHETTGHSPASVVLNQELKLGYKI